MTLRARLLLSLVVASLVLLFLSLYLPASSQDVDHVVNAGRTTAELSRHLYDLKQLSNTLSNRYDPSQAQQWWHLYHLTRQQLLATYFPTEQAAQMADQLFTDLLVIDSQFRAAEQQARAAATPQVDTDESTDLRPEATTTPASTSSDLFLSNDLLIDDAFAISTALEIERQRLRLRTDRLVFTAVMAGLGVLALLQVLQYLNQLRTITKLLVATESISKGDFSKRLKEIGKDEFSRLAKAINVMTQQLNTLYFALEQKVKDRTLDLERASVLDEAVLNAMGEGLLVIDSNRRVIRINNTATTLLQLTNSHVISKVWPEEVLPKPGVVDDKQQPVPLEALPTSKAIATKQNVFSDRLQLTATDGSLIPVSVTSSPIIIADRVFGVVVVFRDISHEISINKAKSEFVSLASHQLRTPLTSIKWYAELLAEEASLTPDQQSYLQELSTGTERMIELITSLLNVSRIEMGTFAVQPEPTQVHTLVASVLEELKPLIEEKKIRIVYQPTPIPEISLDPNLFRMVYQNLLTNAVKYTPEQGTITITHRRSDSQLQIAIADTGMGIPKDQQSLIFQKLFRADNAREVDAGGTGLGLYLVKSIVDACEGSIAFSSPYQTDSTNPQLTQGTQFTVTIPLSGMRAKEGSKPLE